MSGQRLLLIAKESKSSLKRAAFPDQRYLCLRFDLLRESALRKD